MTKQRTRHEVSYEAARVVVLARQICDYNREFVALVRLGPAHEADAREMRSRDARELAAMQRALVSTKSADTRLRAG